MFELAETGSPQLLKTGYNNSVVPCDEISINQFFCFFFFTQHVITCIASRVPLSCVMVDQINKLPEHEQKSSPETSHYLENTRIKLYKVILFLHLIESGFFIVSFQHILHFFLVFLLKTLRNENFQGSSIVFENKYL